MALQSLVPNLESYAGVKPVIQRVHCHDIQHKVCDNELFVTVMIDVINNISHTAHCLLICFTLKSRICFDFSGAYQMRNAVSRRYLLYIAIQFANP